MSVPTDVAIAVLTMPLNVAFFGFLASFPLRLVFHRRSLVIASLAASVAFLFSIAAFREGLVLEVRIAAVVAAVISAPLCYLAWLGREQRKLETVHG